MNGRSLRLLDFMAPIISIPKLGTVTFVRRKNRDRLHENGRKKMTVPNFHEIPL